MERQVLEQIARLGGETGLPGGTMTEQLMSLRFDHALQKRPEPLPWDSSGLDIFRPVFEAHPEIEIDGNLDTEALIGHVFGPEELYNQVRYVPRIFAPFTEGDPMFGELEGLVTEDALRRTFSVPEGPLEFVFVGTSDSFPNYYVVATGDQSPGNPSVFQTDHETFFWTDVDRVGSFADYLAGFTTADELRAYLGSQQP
ncbi:hypothetical protein [Agromyces sp. Root81]|uniref:hypothetical protein n=1 Tax=Agromyces sp. Root81 TaxID=1736601 RepID=UPI0012F7DBE6|nr:hypothetical protein [Agromyces sp. Root81]